MAQGYVRIVNNGIPALERAGYAKYMAGQPVDGDMVARGIESLGAQPAHVVAGIVASLKEMLDMNYDLFRAGQPKDDVYQGMNAATIDALITALTV